MFSAYIGYRAYSTNQFLFPISVFALLTGLIFEYRRISNNWSTILVTALFSFILSFFAFLPFNRETSFILEDRIEIWLYTFLFFFITMAIIIAGKKIIVKITEGITLMLSVAVIYWVIDMGIIYIYNPFINIFIVVGFCFASFSIYCAFSYKILSKGTKLTLSIWSSIVIVLFATDNVYRIYQNGQIEDYSDMAQACYVTLQFFLLGISSMYIVENFFMLLGFLPGQRRFFNEQYYKELKKLKEQHVSRYSSEQVTRVYSLLCILFMGTVFGLNYNYKFVSRNFLIWAVLVLFPIGLNLIRYATRKIQSTADR